jgi:hypothetical protein
LVEERSLLDFIKFNALPGLFAAGYVALTQLQGLPTTWYGTLFFLIVGVFITYGIRRTSVKGGLLKGLDDKISSFGKVVVLFLDLCHKFEANPVKEFENHVDNSHALIVEHWLPLLKRDKMSLGQEIRDQTMARLMKEFLRIVQQYRERVVLPFMNRANITKLVAAGTIDRFGKIRTEYNDMVEEINQLVKDMNAKLKLEKEISERAEKITGQLQIVEPGPPVE